MHQENLVDKPAAGWIDGSNRDECCAYAINQDTSPKKRHSLYWNTKTIVKQSHKSRKELHLIVIFFFNFDAWDRNICKLSFIIQRYQIFLILLKLVLKSYIPNVNSGSAMIRVSGSEVTTYCVGRVRGRLHPSRDPGTPGHPVTIQGHPGSPESKGVTPLQ